MPFFEGLIGQKVFTREAEVYEGMEGLKKVREMALKESNPGDTLYIFGIPASSHEHMLGYADDWNRRRVKKKINAHIIYNQDAKFYGERRKKLPYTKVKYFPTKVETHAWVHIFKDTVDIGLRYKTPTSVIIHNKLFAESFKLYFDILWEASIAF